MKTRQPASTHKKVIVELAERKLLRGYLNPSRLPGSESLDLLTPEGAHEEVALARVRAIYFVRDLDEDIDLERKSFLSRPKLEGLWVRLRFRDGDSLEGVIPNDLLGLLDNGLQITPPDFNSNTDRIFVPRSALAELTVLGVVGIARRKPAPAEGEQPRLFNE
ncbi:MAG TPA: hypothetical protein VED66_07690 [Candidatus Sulfotelmatobacter sp.]|nr:hypothetical protein [Candidatus Sulfotelmatobacter sp.]